MEFYQIVIHGFDGTDIWLVDTGRITMKDLERMEKEDGKYPYWCIPGSAKEGDYLSVDGETVQDALYDIGDIGIRVCNLANGVTPCTICKFFIYYYD